jgi:hypothetical protein
MPAVGMPSLSDASARAPACIRRMGALKALASHQLAKALTTSANPKVVNQIPGRLNAPNALGRRGTSKTV